MVLHQGSVFVVAADVVALFVAVVGVAVNVAVGDVYDTSRLHFYGYFRWSHDSSPFPNPT